MLVYLCVHLITKRDKSLTWRSKAASQSNVRWNRNRCHVSMKLQTGPAPLIKANMADVRKKRISFTPTSIYRVDQKSREFNKNNHRKKLVDLSKKSNLKSFQKSINELRTKFEKKGKKQNSSYVAGDRESILKQATLSDVVRSCLCLNRINRTAET